MIIFQESIVYDSVPHAKLLYKLWAIGITGPLWFWFRAYLADHRHYVKSNRLF